MSTSSLFGHSTWAIAQLFAKTTMLRSKGVRNSAQLGPEYVALQPRIVISPQLEILWLSYWRPPTNSIQLGFRRCSERWKWAAVGRQMKFWRTSFDVNPRQHHLQLRIPVGLLIHTSKTTSKPTSKAKVKSSTTAATIAESTGNCDKKPTVAESIYCLEKKIDLLIKSNTRRRNRNWREKLIPSECCSHLYTSTIGRVAAVSEFIRYLSNVPSPWTYETLTSR